LTNEEGQPFVKRFITLTLVALAAPVFTLACGGGEAGDQAGNVRLRLGYFPNVTHVQPAVGVIRGTFEEHLGDDVTLETKTFNAGPSVIEAIFAGELDASYIGPNPAINGHVRSRGEEVRIVAGATSAGALLIVRPEANISSPADFANKRVATPQLGNTQDVALRAWLAEHGLNAREQGGNVQVLPIANADQLSLFQRGEVDASWAIEPWATRLVQEAGGEIFLDERDLWPDGKFVTTHLIVRTRFLEQHPDVVERLVRAHVETTEWINENPEEAKDLLNDHIEEITSHRLPDRVIDTAWGNIDITVDPVAVSLLDSARDAYELGYLGDREPNLERIYALDILNGILREKNLPEVRDE
jgi:NitT/TauT family transport system substrate-binding protein